MSVKSTKHWSYHDAYQYLERLNLKFAGALTDDPILPLPAQIKYLKDSRPKPQCAFG
jgi:ABC-type Zn2+ transport system substrate-binding protein/surface adhesin